MIFQTVSIGDGKGAIVVVFHVNDIALHKRRPKSRRLLFAFLN